MKSKEITEGFFKGLAKGLGYKDGSEIPSASDAEIDGAVMNKPAIPDDDQLNPDNDEVQWNPDKNLMSISGQGAVSRYQKTRKGWVDFNTKELIDPSDARELETAFDKVTGRRQT